MKKAVFILLMSLLSLPVLGQEYDEETYYLVPHYSINSNFDVDFVVYQNNSPAYFSDPLSIPIIEWFVDMGIENVQVSSGSSGSGNSLVLRVKWDTVTPRPFVAGVYLAFTEGNQSYRASPKPNGAYTVN
ncbi:hypothetical protein [Sinomicrobium sp. M5D2P9]